MSDLPDISPTSTSIRCPACAGRVDANAVVCPTCGEVQSHALEPLTSEKRIVPTLLLCLIFGVFGAHRFYTGRIGTGVVQLLTLGGLGIWAMVDAVLIATGSFRDSEGDRIVEWV